MPATGSSGESNSSAAESSGKSVYQTDGLEMSTVRNNEKLCIHRLQPGWLGGCSAVESVSANDHGRTDRSAVFRKDLHHGNLSGHHDRGLANSIWHSVKHNPNDGAGVSGAAC